MIRLPLIALAGALAAAPLAAQAPMPAPASPPAARPMTIAQAVADPARPAEDVARDADRKPAEMLRFAGVKPGMAVVDLLPGGGYFTRLFADVVGPAGHVWASVPSEMLAKGTKPLDRLQPIAAAHPNVSIEHSALMAPPPGPLADVVWTSQNYHDLHNMAGVDVVAFNRLVYAALKPGGVYVVLDHAAAPGSGLSATNTLHRIDPATVKAEVTQAGFVYDGEDKVLANPADHHDLNVFDKSLRGKTDQFVYRFRKPK